MQQLQLQQTKFRISFCIFFSEEIRLDISCDIAEDHMKCQVLFSLKSNKKKTECHLQQLFVCVEILQPSQSNGVMVSMVSLPNHTFTG